MTATMDGISIDVFNEYITYKPTSGLFVWKKPRRKVAVGSLAFHTHHSAGYFEGGFMMKRFLAHRVDFFMHHRWVPEEVDHINLNKKDNRIINLRPSDKQTNKYNISKRVDNTSGYKGVCFDKRKQKWMARIHSDGKTSFLGYFANKDEAGLAYKKEAARQHGDFMRIE